MLVAIGAFIAMPPFGGFWALLQLVTSLWVEQPGLVAVILVVNVLTAFSLTRLFCRIFLGTSQPMAQRSPEAFWLINLPVVSMAILVCHLPIILSRLAILPGFGEVNMFLAPALFWSSIVGITVGSLIYGMEAVSKPVKLPIPAIQNFFTYDLYVQRLYQVTIVLLVATSARVVNWFDRYIIDGLVNLVGFGTLFSSQSLRLTNSGQSQFYILSMFSGVVILGLLMGLFI
jgi:NAD(P)H-quinone oxidoreductase subunit 5